MALTHTHTHTHTHGGGVQGGPSAPLPHPSRSPRFAWKVAPSCTHSAGRSAYGRVQLYLYYILFVIIYYILFVFKLGYCRYGSTINVKFELRDCNTNVILLCNFNKGKKTKKCGPLYLRGETRKKMIKDFEKTNVYIHRTTQAADLMQPGDPKCPLIRSSNVLHVAQNEEVRINYLHSNPTQALVIMKNMTKYSNCNIGK